ncbi:MAG: RNA methyltransferase [Gemmatimonadetes bacterium]|nr:RNA methyltransferase [Gemmatimonadota bacterium]
MLTRAEEKLLIGLHQRAQREQRQLFLAEGVRVVEALLAAGLPIELAVASSALEHAERGQSLAVALGAAVELRTVPESVLARVAATDAPQGVVVAAHVPAASLEALEPGPRALALVLDAIQDPGNVGTLVRSAHAFGAAFVLALDGTADAWNPKAVRASAGSAFRVPIVHARTDAALAWLRSRRFQVLAADARGSDIAAVRRDDRCALAVGNEGAGTSEAVRAAAETLVAVPIHAGVESLNVGAAAVVLLHELSRSERP